MIKQNLINKLQYPHFTLNYQRYLPHDKASRILDFGCGHGSAIAYLKEAGYTNVVGADTNPVSAAWAKANVSNDIWHIDDPESFLRAHTDQFDFILVKDVIFYFPREKLIPWTRLLRSALKSGGKMMVEITNGASFAGPLVRYKDYRIQHILTEHSLAEILIDSGFSIQVIYGCKLPLITFKRRLFALVMLAWRNILRLIYIAERGLDETNPKILSPRLIAVARASKPDMENTRYQNDNF